MATNYISVSVCLYPVTSGAIHLTQSGSRLHSPFQLSQPAVALTKSHSGTTSLLHQSGTMISSCASVTSTSGMHSATSGMHSTLPYIVPSPPPQLPPSSSQTLQAMMNPSSTSNSHHAPAFAPRRANTSVTIIGQQGSSSLAATQV
ncbi:hypothetical protein B566_EDAN013360 [Ephemera danica]|nr:hypothetical protein B566_EDAN013360 [Ephemera danica]